MKQIFPRILIITGALCVISAMAVAQARGGMGAPAEQTTPTNNNNPGLSSPDQMQQQQNTSEGAMQDKAFVRSALEGGMAEVQMGQLAAQKGNSDDVKQFGQKMVNDHTQLGDQMKQVAQQLNVQPPKGLSKKDKAEVAKLQALSGAQFDNAYIEAMVKDHKKDLSDFKQEAENSQNPAVKQVAQQGAQVIDQHLQQIEQIAKTHNATGM
jgi:putative membrane protein